MQKPQSSSALSAPERWPGLRWRQLDLLLSRLIAGLVVGIIAATTAISYATLIFSGDLAVYRTAGIGFSLFTALVAGIVVSLTNSFPSAAVKPQDTPAAITAVMVGAIAATVPASAGNERLFATVVVTIALTSLFTGIFFFGLGLFRLGNLVRYIPYPVMGGYMAGIGWLLAQGAIQVMTDSPVNFSASVNLGQPDLLWRWLPGCLFGLALLLLVRRFRHPLIVPAMLVAALLLFYLVLWLAGATPAEARAAGWLLGPFPKGVLWRPLPPSLLAQVSWPVLLAQLPGMGTIVLVSAMDLLLCASGLELTARRDVDLNRELRAAGLANLLTGLGGGLVGYQTQSLSTLGYRIGGGSRLVGLVAALTCGAVLFVGTGLLAYLPKPVLGGLLSFLGLNYLVTWVYDAWFKLPKVDYAVLLLILLSINFLGILESIGLGITVMIVLFIVHYSRLEVVKHELSGRSYRSNVDRPQAHREILQQQGDQIFILRLQGFLFFGTAHRLLARVQRRVRETTLPMPRFIILDLGHVWGMEASAILGMAELVQFVHNHGFDLVFTALPPGIEARLERAFGSPAPGDWRTFLDLDRGAEWCEEQLLHRGQGEDATIDTGAGRSFEALLSPALLRQIACRELQPGDYLIRYGDPPLGIFFVESGGLTAQLEYGDGRTVRLRRMGPGAIIGEIGFYTGREASAWVVADEASRVLYLSQEQLNQAVITDPQSLAVFHRAMARLASERLLDATATMRSLLS
jgi:SulP family sulfate permease